METRYVAGICLERDGATIVVASHAHQDIMGETDPPIEVHAHDYEPWSIGSYSQAEAAIRGLVENVAAAYPLVGSVGVACYGPFVSLTPTDPTDGDYGLVCPLFSDMPFSGWNLHNDIRNMFLSAGFPESIKVTVNTDAHAFTMGEAFAAKNDPNHILVGILVTEGVGAGIVLGRTSLKCALHPEVGLVMSRFDKDDSLKPPPGDRLFSRGVGELANNAAMRDRYAREYEMSKDEVDDTHLTSWRDHHNWEFRAYYLAQLCLSCTAIISPHRIVLATNLDPRGTLLDDTRRFFCKLLEARYDDKEPFIGYPKIDEVNGFITAVSKLPFDPESEEQSSIGLRGAVGVALDAARAKRAQRRR